jgi:hypothetical protein
MVPPPMPRLFSFGTRGKGNSAFSQNSVGQQEAQQQVAQQQATPSVARSAVLSTFRQHVFWLQWCWCLATAVWLCCIWSLQNRCVAFGHCRTAVLHLVTAEPLCCIWSYVCICCCKRPWCVRHQASGCSCSTSAVGSHDGCCVAVMTSHL